ncbi:MAG: phage recombination protein Bet [Roseateles sp.]|uniref:phage recombination protein Bet n=1 Tax=Roseateles sp. TaxID=1971397 RepID=UPI004036BB77
MNAITRQEGGALALSEPELLDVLSSSLYPGANHGSIRMVLGYCKAAGLDPMQKPVHIVPMWDSKAGQMRDVVMPGVGLYRTQASRSNQMAGISEPEFGPMLTEEIGGQTVTYPDWCKVTVKRLLPSGQVATFTAVEYWTENYAIKGGKEKSIAPNAMWSKRPRGQLAKCAEAQALRKAFPEVGSTPTAEEMEGKALDAQAEPKHMGAAEVVGSPPPPPPPATWPDDKFAEQMPRWTRAVAEGIKTTNDILGWALARGALTPEQTAQINALKREESPATEATEAAE